MCISIVYSLLQASEGLIVFARLGLSGCRHLQFVVDCTRSLLIIAPRASLSHPMS